MRKKLCIECKKKPIHYKKRQLCISCYSKLRYKSALPNLSEEKQSPYVFIKKIYEREIEFIKNFFNHNNWVHKPGLFHLNSEKYSPDFYDSERNVWIEVAGTRQAYHENKHKYALLRELYPKLNFEIRKPSGELLDEENHYKEWEQQNSNLKKRRPHNETIYSLKICNFIEFINLSL